MNFDPIEIKRIGFDDYACNVIVNHIENREVKNGFKVDNEHYTLTVCELKDHYIFKLRAYVKTIGWKEYELTLKTKYINQ